MKLNEEERKILLNFGYNETDLKQIQRLHYKFILCEEGKAEKQIKQKEAKRILNATDFLTGIARASFHCTAMREKIYIERVER